VALAHLAPVAHPRLVGEQALLELVEAVVERRPLRREPRARRVQRRPPAAAGEPERQDDGDGGSETHRADTPCAAALRGRLEKRIHAHTGRLPPTGDADGTAIRGLLAPREEGRDVAVPLFTDGERVARSALV
jgi:hypothetical protein